MLDRDLFRSLDWELRDWEPSYELIRRATGTRTFWLGKKFDEEVFRVARVVDHNHCANCMKTFSADPTHEGRGYWSDEEGWLCRDCHRRLSESG